MELMVYDGTFEGWITTVFEVYEHGFKEVNITTKEKMQPGMFGAVHYVTNSDIKISRVLKGLEQKVSPAGVRQLYAAFLSGNNGIENMLLQYVQYAFATKMNIEKDYSNAAVLYVQETAKKVHREKHRMEAFIRFQLTKDGIYYAICDPDFNVLPLIENHFQQRYADQRWLIYDSGRKYGLYYDLEKVEVIQLTFKAEINSGNNIGTIYDDTETLYQDLWQCYFKSVNIVARKNTRLHIQHMPKRYWKYLTEKQTR